MLLRPGDTLLNSIAYKLAFTCYIATLFNANPLLELDGYYILVDWLRLPDLRRRALEFVRGPLWKNALKIENEKDGSQHDQHRVQPFLFSIQFSTREERIFTIYGLLALPTRWWRSRSRQYSGSKKLIGTIGGLLENGGTLGRVVAAALILLVVLPLLAGLFFAGLGLGRAALAWVIRRATAASRPCSPLAGVLALLLALLANDSSGAGAPGGWVARLMPPLLWSVTLGALLAVRPDYLGVRR